jgi:diguanylate cyclase (GGDEF)-like protein/PAS domain S-box-containing protein
MRVSQREVQAAAVVTATKPCAELTLALIDSLEAPLLVCDAEGRLVLANQAARELLGLTDGLDVDGFNWVEENDAHTPVAMLDPLWRALQGDDMLPEELYLLTRSGASLPVQVTASGLHDAHGEPLGAVMTLLPVRAESATEQRLRVYASDMELLQEVSQTLAELQDPDQAASVICTVATGATGAIAVLLWEHAGDGLVIRCCEGGVSAEDLAEISEQARAGATRAASESKTVVEDPAERQAAGEQVAQASQQVRLGSAWHQPLTKGGAVTGVLSILWPGLLNDLERPGLLIRSLSDHAATALERAGLMRRLSDAARTDQLTGLANRRVWDESLQRELLRSRRDGQPLSLVLIDIDHFKAYNDQHGHPEGDQLLQHAARAWSQQLRTTDLIARVGGEEFAVLLPGCPIDQAPLVAERLRSAMPDAQTCSLGVATWNEVASAAELYATADIALYQAKRDGRNQVQISQIQPTVPDIPLSP